MRSVDLPNEHLYLRICVTNIIPWFNIPDLSPSHKKITWKKIRRYKGIYCSFNTALWTHIGTFCITTASEMDGLFIESPFSPVVVGQDMLVNSYLKKRKMQGSFL